MIRQMVRVVLTALIACGASFAAQTWAGEITASMCGKSHMDRKCVQNCIKAGEKYVFVRKGQIHEIHNQDFGGLETHAGHSVKLTGTLGSDGKTVTVSKIEMVSAK